MSKAYSNHLDIRIFLIDLSNKSLIWFNLVQMTIINRVVTTRENNALDILEFLFARKLQIVNFKE